jgi:hypothetical protein
MEARLIILLACVSVSMFLNTIVLWLVFRIFGNLASKVTAGVHEFEVSSSTRQWLATAQTASENAVKVTGTVREELAALQPSLERMQAEHSERLAKAEVRCKMVFKAVTFAVESIDTVVTWPIRNLRKAVSVAESVFAFIRGTERGSGARSRRSQ